MEQREHILSPDQLADAVTASIGENGSFVLTVTGGSMVPALLHQKSQVELTAPGEVKPGHIVLVRRPNGSLVLHRVVERQGSTLTLNGDAQSWTERVDISCVLARVSRIFRKGRWYDTGTLADKAYYKLWGLAKPLRPTFFKVYNRVKRKQHDLFPKSPTEN